MNELNQHDLVDGQTWSRSQTLFIMMPVWVSPVIRFVKQPIFQNEMCQFYKQPIL
jgi:hypothetical protein